MKSTKTRSSAVAGALAGALLTGCAVNYPQNAQEFRDYVPGATFGKKESFEARRSWREIAKTFQQKAPECLNVSVRTISQSATSYQNILATYKPTVVLGADKAELHVQRHYQGGGIIVPGKEPEGGFFLLVADVAAIDRNRSRVDIYAPTHGASAIVRAVTGWATGENVGCPDMTKN